MQHLKYSFQELNLDKEDLIKRADLEESTIDEVISTLKKEFE